MTKSVSPRAMLLIIAAMFLLPLVLAWLMYSGTLDFRPESTKNRGILIDPPVPMDWGQATVFSSRNELISADERLLEHWTVMYPLATDCHQNCQSDLATLRQVHLASGRHGSRIRLVVLFENQPAAGSEELIGEIYDQYVLAVDNSGVLSEAIQSVASSVSQPLGTYLIDPLGNIMMVYAANADPNDLKQDLKRLLTWSKLDEQ